MKIQGFGGMSLESFTVSVSVPSVQAFKPGEQDYFWHPHVRFHFTPTYSSWLNQVELWFVKIQRDVIRRSPQGIPRPSSKPYRPRWIGSNPTSGAVHGPRAKRSSR